MSRGTLQAAIAAWLVSLCLMPQLAGAVTLQFEASFDGYYGPGLVSGLLEAVDRDGNGLAELGEVQSFAFYSEFMGSVLDFNSHQGNYRIFGMAGSEPLASGFGFDTIGFVQFLSTSEGGVGWLSVLTLSQTEITVMQFGSAGFAMEQSAPILTIHNTAAPTTIPVPQTMSLLLSAIVLFLLASRGQLIMHRITQSRTIIWRPAPPGRVAYVRRTPS